MKKTLHVEHVIDSDKPLVCSYFKFKSDESSSRPKNDFEWDSSTDK